MSQPAQSWLVLKKVLFAFLSTLLLSVVARSQPLAFHAFDFSQDVVMGPAMSVREDEESTTAIEKLSAETERNLHLFMDDVDRAQLAILERAGYGHITRFLADLRAEHGDHPFYSEAFHRPLVQQMTGFNFGHAGMPIATTEKTAEGLVVRLATKTQEAKIHFTTDGSLPDGSSPLWTGSHVLRPGEMIKAITIRSDLEFSPVLVVTTTGCRKESPVEMHDEDKIMGVFQIPGSDEVLIKYKTAQPGLIRIYSLDDTRQKKQLAEIYAEEAGFGTTRIRSSHIQPGASYLIKFGFYGSGKVTYRQMVRQES